MTNKSYITLIICKAKAIHAAVAEKHFVVFIRTVISAHPDLFFDTNFFKFLLVLDKSQYAYFVASVSSLEAYQDLVGLPCNLGSFFYWVTPEQGSECTLRQLVASSHYNGVRIP